MIDPKICLDCRSTLVRNSVDELVGRIHSIEVEREGRVYCPAVERHVYFDGTHPPDDCPYKLEHAISAGCKRSQPLQEKDDKNS